MTSFTILIHKYKALGFRYFGLGPNLLPLQGISQLKSLLDKNAAWARNRNKQQLRKMLSKSPVIVTLWNRKQLIGFGRATTDTIYRAVLWDVVVDHRMQGNGVGKDILFALLRHEDIKNVEKIYLMTSQRADFYLRHGFEVIKEQKLLMLNNKPTTSSSSYS